MMIIIIIIIKIIITTTTRSDQCEVISVGLGFRMEICKGKQKVL